MDFEKLIEHRNANSPHCQRLGIRIEKIALGWAVVSKTITPEDLNPVERVHGGIYFSMADTACGSAVASHGTAAVTVGAHYNFFRSAEVGDLLIAEAREIKSGQTIAVVDVQITDQDGLLLGNGSFTFYRLDEEIEYD